MDTLRVTIYDLETDDCLDDIQVTMPGLTSDDSLSEAINIVQSWAYYSSVDVGSVWYEYCQE